MRLSIPMLLSAFLMIPGANLAFAQDGEPGGRSAIAAAPAASSARTTAPTTAARDASSPADHGDSRLCFGFIEFDFDCDAPAAHSSPLPPSPAELAQAGWETGRSGADQPRVR